MNKISKMEGGKYTLEECVAKDFQKLACRCFSILKISIQHLGILPEFEVRHLTSVENMGIY